MRIGTDVSLKTCKEEGYLMMEYKVRELMSKGVLNPDVPIRFIEHVPEYILKEKYAGMMPFGVKTIITDVDYTSNDIWKMYLEYKKEIDECAGFSHEFPTSPHKILSIANDVNMYCGL